MSANSVSAVCIHVTVMAPRLTFIDIYKKNNALDTIRLKVVIGRGTPVISSAFNTCTVSKLYPNDTDT